MWSLSGFSQEKIPLYQKIVRLIEQLISQGALVADVPLPAERKLATLLDVNRSTVIHALDILSERGVLIRRVGSGTYINPDKWGVQTQPVIRWQNTLKNKSSYDLTPYQRQVKQLYNNVNGHHILNLANGDLADDLLPSLKMPELPWSELIVKETESESDKFGLLSLRKSVQRYLQVNYQLTVPVDEILITSGTQHALFLITQGLLKAGDSIGVEAPSYFYSLPLFQASGIRIIPIATDEEGIVPSELATVVTQRNIKMLFINPIFQNPTGSVMSRLRKEVILDYCKKHQIPIVEDDAYSALRFNDTVDIAPLKQLDVHQQVIYVGSLSKYVGPHLRIGWMVGPKQILADLAHIRQNIDSGLSILPQLLADHFLKEEWDSQIRLLKQQLSRRSERLQNWLNDRFADDVVFNSPLGGYHLYARFPHHNRTQLTQLLQSLLSNGIVVTEGALFGERGSAIRLSFGHFKERV